MKYEKTAKDKAFDRERTKLQGQILSLKRAATSRETYIAELEKTVKEQAATVEHLHSQLLQMARIAKLSEEDIVLLLTKEKRTKEMLDLLKIFGGVGV